MCRPKGTPLFFSVILKGNNLYDFLFTDMSGELFQSNLTLVEEEKVSVCWGWWGGGGGRRGHENELLKIPRQDLSLI